MGKVYQERILLTGKDILEKEFKIDTRGYRPQEVDKYLDVIIRDYEEFVSIIRELENDKKELLVTVNELNEIIGGAKKTSFALLIGGIITVIIGIIDGYLRPLKCNK